MTFFDLSTFFIARRNGISNVNAALVSAALPSTTARGLGIAGNVLLADTITKRIAVQSGVKAAQAPSLKFAPLPIVSSSFTPSLSLGQLLGVAPVAASGTATSKPADKTAVPAAYFQKIEGASIVDFTANPPEIEGPANALRIDLVSPSDAAKYSWDFGKNAGINSSSAQNPAIKTYATAGNYEIILTTEDSTGKEFETIVAKITVT